MSDLVGNPEDRFSDDAAQIMINSLCKISSFLKDSRYHMVKITQNDGKY